MATLISAELEFAADQIVHHCGYPSAVLSGLKPDPRHLENGGFHCSLEDLKAHGNQNDFSNTRADDKGFNPLYGAAGDVSLTKTDMVKACGRVRAVWADRSDPRREYVNAVNCWDGSGDATRFDFDAGVAKYASPDHVWHVHFEIHRRYVRDPKAARAVVSMFAGESKAAWIAREVTNAQGDDMNAAEMTAWASSSAGKTALAAAAGSGVHGQKIGKSATTIGMAFETLLVNAGVDEHAIIGGILAALNPQQIADLVVAAMPADQARRTADELATRLQS